MPAQRIGVVRRRVELARPVAFRIASPSVAAIVEHGVIEGAGAHRGVEVVHGLAERGRIERELAREFADGRRLHRRKDRRHEQPDRFGVDDRIGDLPRLLRHQPAPDGVALGPGVLALVVEALASRLTMMPNTTLSSRVAMPPSNLGARASMATAWHCVGSPTGATPASSSILKTSPRL